MKKLLFGALSVLIVVVLLSRCGGVRKTSSTQEFNGGKSPLALYGKEIFERESCINCHTFQIDNASPEMISLDGIGGKYSSGWLYYYLSEPQTVIPESEKDASEHLVDTPLDKEVLAQIVTSKEENRSWELLVEEASVLAEDIKEHGRTAHGTEVLALISYLQSVPASRRKIELDSIKHVEYLNEQKLWGSIFLDSANVIIDIANDPAMAKEGVRLFHTNCAVCHGAEGQGFVGPNLTDEYWIHGSKKADIARTIIHGAKNGMISWKDKLHPTEVGQLVSFIYSLKGTDPPNAKAPQGTKD